MEPFFLSDAPSYHSVIGYMSKVTLYQYKRVPCMRHARKKAIGRLELHLSSNLHSESARKILHLMTEKVEYLSPKCLEMENHRKWTYT